MTSGRMAFGENPLSWHEQDPLLHGRARRSTGGDPRASLALLSEVRGPSKQSPGREASTAGIRRQRFFFFFPFPPFFGMTWSVELLTTSDHLVGNDSELRWPPARVA